VGDLGLEPRTLSVKINSLWALCSERGSTTNTDAGRRSQVAAPMSLCLFALNASTNLVEGNVQSR
jgi:hypothetical protein